MKNLSTKNCVHKIFHIILFILGPALIWVFVLYFNYGENTVFKKFGIFSWILSAFLGWLPIYTFKKKGKVQKGKSFVKTNKLVTTGIYSIVRHPQYLSGMLLGLSFILISQHWLVLILAIPFITIFYIATLDEDKSCLKKFGFSYKEYMKKVPRINFILGLIRLIYNKK